MLLNLDQLEKQIDKEEFQETGSMDAFRVLKTQFQLFINFRYYFDDDDGLMIRKMSERHMQLKERNVNSSKALDASLVVTECSETKSNKQVTSSSLGNYITHVVDADIRPVMTKCHLLSEYLFKLVHPGCGCDHLYVYVTGSSNDPTVNPSLSNMLYKSVFIQSHTIIGQDERLQSYYGLTLTDIPASDSKGNDKAKRVVNITFSLCCQKGKVVLPRFKEVPPPLNKLLDYNEATTTRFKDQIRVYNDMFCFTSFRAKIDHSINTRRGPYTFRVYGQNYHRMGSLLSAEGVQPRYAQLYFFDTENKIGNQMSALVKRETADGNIVASLIQMLN
nr:hypothetical protein [Tanacetum cinerariifolium]